jgi:hypothetical protein
MLGEILRDLGILGVIFIPLDRGWDVSGHFSIGLFIAAVSISLVLMAAGIWVERRF